jgi:hypothetical protein
MTNFQEFVWQAYDLVKQALPKYSTKYSRKDFTQHQLAVLLLIWAKCYHGYRGTIEMVWLMTPIRDHLELETMPDPSTLYHPLDRMSMTLGRLFLSESLKPFDLSDFFGLDATGFKRTGASQYYATTANMNIKNIKTTVLADFERNVVNDVHFTTT